MKSLSLNIAAILSAIAIINVAPASAQQRPLVTEDVEVVKPGSVRFELGFDFLQDKDFPLSGLNGDLTRVGVLGLRFGLASNVEVEAGGVLQNYLSINRQYQASSVPLQIAATANSTNDIGDFHLATKIKLHGEGRRAPGFGFRFGVELPNTNQAKGIGVNQTNFFADTIAGKHFGRLHIFSNLGIGILPAPVSTFSQNDVLLYGLAATYRFNDRFTLVSEANGRHSTRN